MITEGNKQKRQSQIDPALWMSQVYLCASSLVGKLSRLVHADYHISFIGVTNR
jgi:hypothetical protein